MIIHQPRYSKEEIDVAASDADPLVGMVLLYGFKLQNKHQLYA